MTPNQYLWTQARDRLVAAVTSIGFSAELAELMAKQLGSPKAIDRMVSYPAHRGAAGGRDAGHLRRDRDLAAEEGEPGGAGPLQLMALLQEMGR